MKRLLLSFLFLTNIAYAQSINPRWLGVWEFGQERVSITPTAFDNCQWMNTPNPMTSRCTAFYDGTIPKYMLWSGERDMSSANLMLKQRLISSIQYSQIKQRAEITHINLMGISEDTFKLVRVNYDFRNSSSGTVFFLDKENIYRITSWGNEVHGIIIDKFYRVY
jgi:hypothetical protein